MSNRKIKPHEERTIASLRQSLLQIDACIIDGDDENVVFALRIPRKVIRDNHHFLLAASEAAADCRRPEE
jgi:hypothetical protein